MNLKRFTCVNTFDNTLAIERKGGIIVYSGPLLLEYLAPNQIIKGESQ